MQKHLIAIAGVKESGKSTAARYIRSKIGGFILPLAKEVRKEVDAMLYLSEADYDRKCLYGNNKEHVISIPISNIPDLWLEYGILDSNLVRSDSCNQITTTVREILQFHGTEVRRKQDLDHWIKKLILTYSITIVDDVRFENELIALRQKAKVNNYKFTSIYRQHELASDHISEVSAALLPVDQFNWVLPKYQNINHLYPILDKIIGELNGEI